MTPPERVNAEGLKMSPKQRGRKPDWKIPKNSMVKRKALAIVAMRANGYTDDQISEELHITKGSIRTYLYRATRSGFLVDRKSGSLLADPHDRLEYDLAHKAVRNLEAMLDSDTILERGQKSVRMEATLEMAKGVLFKKFDQAAAPSMPTNVLQIKIEGAQSKVDVTAGGAPLYIDGDVVSQDEPGD